ncbi:MAG: DUF58 domain-containing protein [Actinomycetota bacterium]|nr:DUF58 domain-containing protein [Actinomycetota bacterium]
MHEALSGLTTRGRCFLAAGGAAALCSLVLHERDLFRVAVFLIVLPLVAAVGVTRTRYRLACSRLLDPPQIPVGQQARVLLRLENVSRLPSGIMLLEDTLPYTLGGRPRFVLDRVRPRAVRSVHYPVRADVRGRYVIGPLSVRLADPFGLVELSRSFASFDTLTVTPVIHPLTPIRLGGEWAGGGDSRARSVSPQGEDDATTREYRHGDDLRKVHWRSTARVGELMVRREEQPWQSRAAVALDTRAAAHRGDGPGSSFEWAVSAAASVAVHLAGAGYSLRLLTDAGADLHAPAGGNSAVMLLDQLAEIRHSRSRSVAPVVEALRRSSGEGLVVAVLGWLTPEDAELVARARTAATVGVAVLVDSATWVGLSPRSRAEAREEYDHVARTLISGGWRVLEARHGTALAQLWPLASARSSAGQSARSGGRR